MENYLEPTGGTFSEWHAGEWVVVEDVYWDSRLKNFVYLPHEDNP